MDCIHDREINIRLSIKLLEEMKFENIEKIETELRNMNSESAQKTTSKIEELYKKYKINEELAKVIQETKVIGVEAVRKKYKL